MSTSTSALVTAFSASWAALHTFQYGLAISGLNGVQSALTCENVIGGGGGGHLLDPLPSSTMIKTKDWFKPCVSMSPTEFGIVVAIFTMGGLIGALSSTSITRRVGSVGTLRTAATCSLIGSACVAASNSVTTMIVGRVLVGLGSGFATTTVPLFLAHVAPPAIRKSLGIMNQLFIVFGVLVGQSLAFPFNKPYFWRYVPTVAVGAATIQLIGSLWMKEGGKKEDDVGERRDEESSPLLGAVQQEEKPLSIWEALRSKDVKIRRGLAVVLITQLAQQLCGISAVMYFSTSILKPVFQSNAKFIALAIVILKIPVTITPAFMIERLGSRPLLLFPTAIMSLASLLLAIGINTSAGFLSAFSILLFVTAFSVGLGPVTWVVLSEVMPIHSRPAASSIGLAVNWTTNFVIGTTFFPLQQWLSGGKDNGRGNIFYLYAVTCMIGTFAIRVGYRSLAKMEA